jgi:hypothetical protein
LFEKVEGQIVKKIKRKPEIKAFEDAPDRRKTGGKNFLAFMISAIY